jgi:mono/diheme cytochrome c family protein
MTSRINIGGWKRSLPVVFLLVLATMAFVPRLAIGASEAPLQAFEAGPAQEAEALFQAQCSACHTIGGGDGVGPDLEGVTTRRDRDWLTRWIADPAAMLADGDPIATEMLAQFNNVPMPTLGLSDAEVESLVVYLEELDGGAAPVPTTPPVDTGDGDVETGRNLFTGASTFQNGAPSCRACHSAAGIGGFDGGGNLGPDLTAAYDKLGDAVVSWPETSPTMRPIFTDKTLTEDEKADLLAFFRSTDLTERSSAVIWQLGGLALAGTALIALIAHVIWRKRLGGVRRPMVDRRP